MLAEAAGYLPTHRANGVEFGGSPPREEELVNGLSRALQDIDAGEVENAIYSLNYLVGQYRVALESTVASNNDIKQVVSNSKAEVALELAAEQLEQLKDLSPREILGKVTKVFEPIVLAVTSAVVCLFPSPMSVSLLMATTALYLDGELAESTDSQSLFSELSGWFREGLGEILPDGVASSLSAVAALVVVVGVSRAAVGGTSAMGNSTPSLSKLFSGWGEGLDRGVVIRQLAQRMMSVSELTETGLNLTGQYFDLELSDHQVDISILSAQLKQMGFGEQEIDKLLQELFSHFEALKSTRNV